jgi:nucleoid DNA-binding protein
MNKLDLIQKLGDQQNLTRNHATKVVDLFFDRCQRPLPMVPALKSVDCVRCM